MPGEGPHIGKQDDTVLNSSRAKEEILKEMRKHFGLNGNENTTYQHLRAATEAVHGGKSMALAVPAQEGTSQTSEPSIYSRKLEREEQIKPKVKVPY